jgi:hypothetical protein
VKRAAGIAGATIVLVAVLGGVWAYWASAWLWDDFRSGYTVGEALDGSEPGPPDEACVDAMLRQYGQVLADTDEARMFWSGCERARAGEANDFWRVNDYLDD